MPHPSAQVDDGNAPATYSAINGRPACHKLPANFYLGEPVNPTYETIDVESDSVSDPTYSKVSILFSQVVRGEEMKELVILQVISHLFIFLYVFWGDG